MLGVREPISPMPKIRKVQGKVDHGGVREETDEIEPPDPLRL